MPQAFRQRGKKKKKESHAEEKDFGPVVRAGPASGHLKESNDYLPLEPTQEDFEQPTASASHFPPPPLEENEFGGADGDVAPFGFVSPELKAYLKEAQGNLVQLEQQRSQGHRPDGEYGEDDGAGEQAELLRMAMLREMDGQELACATEGEASISLEAIVDGLDSRKVRILADRMSGSCSVLAAHRFGSHVLQTVLRALQYDVSADFSSKGKQAASRSDEDEGLLRTSEQLILAIVGEVVPDAQRLLQGTFSTHVVRTMLQLLAGQDIQIAQGSKKSLAFRAKAKQAHDDTANGTRSANKRHAASLEGGASEGTSGQPVPASFTEALTELRSACLPRDITGRNEARALIVSPAAAPTFSLLLSLEAAAGESMEADSLADVVLEGLIGSVVKEGPSSQSKLESQDGVETLLRHPSGSHALEALLRHLSTAVADCFWTTYIQGKATRLACHPVANFVVATVVKRLGPSLLRDALVEIEAAQGGKMVRENKTGVLLACLARASLLASKVGEQEKDLPPLGLTAVLSSFGLETGTSSAGALLVQCILALKTKASWDKMMRRKAEKQSSGTSGKSEPTESLEDGAVSAMGKRKRRDEDAEEHDDASLRPEEVTVQGSVLLQSLVRLPEPHNAMIYEAILQLPEDRLPAYLTNPVSSHVFLYALSSPSASFAQRRRLLTRMAPLLPTLADDKYGSRVADAVWCRLDGYGREKAMREHILPQEKFLVSSYYGRFFASKRCNVALYRKDKGKWKDWDRGLAAQNVQEGIVPDLASEGGFLDAEHEQLRSGVIEASEGADDSTGGLAESKSRAERKKEKKKAKAKAKTYEERQLDSILAGA